MVADVVDFTVRAAGRKPLGDDFMRYLKTYLRRDTAGATTAVFAPVTPGIAATHR